MENRIPRFTFPNRCPYCYDLQERCVCGTVECEGCGEVLRHCTCNRPRCPECGEFLSDCACPIEDDYISFDDREDEAEDLLPDVNPMQAQWNAGRYRSTDSFRALYENTWQQHVEPQQVRPPRMIVQPVEFQSFSTGFDPWKPQPIVPEELVFNRPCIFETRFEPYTKYELRTVPHSMLTPKGVEDIRYWLHERHRINWTYTVFTDWVGLEENIQHHIFEFEGEEFNAGGKLINRLSKILLKRHNVKLSESDKSHINTLIENQWVGGESFWIDRPTIVDWEAGAFGEKDKKSDDGSCWWYSGGLNSSDSRIGRFNTAMQAGLCGALRLWLLDDQQNFHGVGRVWYIRTREGNPILFNGYGLTTIQWAAKLSKLLSTDHYEKVDLFITPDMVINNNAGIVFDIHNKNYRGGYEFDLVRRTER